MSVDFNRFAHHYRRFLRLIELTSSFVPASLQQRLARIIGRSATPYNLMADTLCQAMSSGLSLNHHETVQAWRRWRESHALFALAAMQYEKMDTAWLHKHVQVSSPDLLAKIASTGGLLLSYHTHHQNTLAASFGIAGCTISGVAASAAGSPLYATIGHYIDRINEGSEKHFRGGSYLYIDHLKEILKQVRMRLQRGELILSLCDFNQASTCPPHRFLGRAITPPTGVIRLALQCEVPIYQALMYPDDKGKLLLLIQECSSRQTLHDTLTAYLAFLEKVVRDAPEAWQGWEWFSNFAPETTAVEHRGEGEC